MSYHGQFSSLITYFPCFICILYFPKAYLSRIASQLPGIYKMLPSSLNLTLPKFWQVLQEFKLMRSFSISKAVFTLSLFSSTQSKQLFFPLKVDNLTEAYEIRVLQTLICSFSSASEHAWDFLWQNSSFFLTEACLKSLKSLFLLPYQLIHCQSHSCPIRTFTIPFQTHFLFLLADLISRFLIFVHPKIFLNWPTFLMVPLWLLASLCFTAPNLFCFVKIFWVPMQLLLFPEQQRTKANRHFSLLRLKPLQSRSMIVSLFLR